MACHYPNQEATEQLRQALVSMSFKDRMGGDDEYPYLRKVMIDDDPEALCQVAKSIISKEFESGASEIVWKAVPLINGYENKREHTLALVLEYFPYAAGSEAAASS